MTRFQPRLAAASALLVLAACVAPDPPAREAVSPLLAAFRDPFGRVPASLTVSEGSRIRIDYVDSLFLSRSADEQQMQAHVIARYLWMAFASGEGVDVVSVAFTDRGVAGAASAKKTTHAFHFYPPQLRDAGAASAAP